MTTCSQSTALLVVLAIGHAVPYVLFLRRIPIHRVFAVPPSLAGALTLTSLTFGNGTCIDNVLGLSLSTATVFIWILSFVCMSGISSVLVREHPDPNVTVPIGFIFGIAPNGFGLGLLLALPVIGAAVCVLWQWLSRDQVGLRFVTVNAGAAKDVMKYLYFVLVLFGLLFVLNAL